MAALRESAIARRPRTPWARASCHRPRRH